MNVYITLMLQLVKAGLILTAIYTAEYRASDFTPTDLKLLYHHLHFLNQVYGSF